MLASPNLAYAIVPPWKAFDRGCALALFLAQLGTFTLARRLRIGLFGALLAGIAYGLSGPVTALLLRIHETAILPWVLVGVHACFSSLRRRTALLATAAPCSDAAVGLPGSRVPRPVLRRRLRP